MSEMRDLGRSLGDFCRWMEEGMADLVVGFSESYGTKEDPHPASQAQREWQALPRWRRLWYWIWGQPREE